MHHHYCLYKPNNTKPLITSYTFEHGRSFPQTSRAIRHFSPHLPSLPIHLHLLQNSLAPPRLGRWLRQWPSHQIGTLILSNLKSIKTPSNHFPFSYLFNTTTILQATTYHFRKKSHFLIHVGFTDWSYHFFADRRNLRQGNCDRHKRQAAQLRPKKYPKCILPPNPTNHPHIRNWNFHRPSLHNRPGNRGTSSPLVWPTELLLFSQNSPQKTPRRHRRLVLHHSSRQPDNRSHFRKILQDQFKTLLGCQTGAGGWLL